MEKGNVLLTVLYDWKKKENDNDSTAAAAAAAAAAVQRRRAHARTHARTHVVYKHISHAYAQARDCTLDENIWHV